MEVLHGDIRITLSDAEAIRGLQRTRAMVKRGLAQIGREKAVVNIEGNLRDLKKDLKEAQALVGAHNAKIKRLEEKREGLSGAQKGAITRKINAEKELLEVAQKQLTAMKAQRTALREQIDERKFANKQARLGTREAEAHLRAEEAVNSALVKQGRIDERNARAEQAASRRAENDQRAMLRSQQKALDIDTARLKTAADLQQEYNKANQALQRLQQQGRARRAVSPEAKAEFEIKEAQALGQMQVLRAKLAALGQEPIDIRVNVKQSRALEKLLGIGDIGIRLGPFAGTLKQFSLAALALGPILVGLLGTVTALAGAIGAGLTGGLGLAAAAATGFGLSLGGVGFLAGSLFRDFKNLNTLQDAYHKQVLKTGANSEKAKTKLQEFRHALGEVAPTTLQAFQGLDKLQGRWRDMSKEARPDFYKAFGETITTLNTDFDIFSRNTLKAFSAVTDGWNKWMRALRGGEAQNVIFTIMDNANRGITPLLSGLGHLGAAWGRITASFSRYFPSILGGFDRWAAGMDEASQNTDKVNRGVDRLMGSLRSTGGVAVAFGRVLKELGAASMGPGGSLMDDIAGGLNDIADSIHDDPRAVRDFFSDSIDTVKALYNVLLPLTQLFLEFSTILRPATTALLSIIGPVANLVQYLAGLGPIRTALQAWATLWLFRKGTALAVGTLAGAVNGLAAAFTRAGRAAAGAKLTGIATSLGGRGPAVRGGPVIAPGASMGARVPVGGRVAGGGIAGGLGATSGIARGASAVTRGLGALSMGLLGVSAPVAGLGLAAVGAYIGLKKLKEGADERARAEKAAAKFVGKENLPKSPQQQAREAPLGTPGVGGIRDRVQYGDQIAEINKLRKAYNDVTNAVMQSGLAQRNLVSLGSQLSNSRLMVESAEKAYADAVKNSGKKSLEARQALQQLRDARTADIQASRAWTDGARDAIQWMDRAVKKAQTAFEASRGTAAENVMAKRLDAAKNSAAALEINLKRARKGMEIFTGQGSEKIGAFLREYGKLPGVKRIMLQVETQQAAQKLATVITGLEEVGKKRTVARILANADNPKQALKLLNAALDKWERRHPAADLEINKQKADKKLSDLNNALSHYGARKPQALLDARNKASEKVKRLEAQLDHLNGKESNVKVNVKFKLPDAFDASDGYRGIGDGEGVPSIASALQGYAMKNGGKLSNMMLGAGGLGSANAPGKGLNAFNRLATGLGLTVGSGFREGSITSSGNLSYHAMGRARDFPGPPAAMLRFARLMAATYGRRLKELIYTPMGFSIKDGKRVPPYAQADHYDHVHVAMAQGGERPRSGKYSQPTVLFAEEPNRPEYFISTNPRDRKRSQGLVAQAAADVGMLEHKPLFDSIKPMASGGAFGKMTPRAKKIWDFFIKAGFTRQQAAGFIGNFMQESGLDPTSKQKGGPGRGLAQWGGGRFKALQKFAAKRHSTWDALDTQLAFVLHELRGPERKAGKSIRSAKSVKAAVKAIGQDYERFGVGGNRYGPAFTAFAAFKDIPKGKVGAGGTTEPTEIPTRGPSFDINTRLATTQGRLDVAATTATNFQDDLNAIYGYDTPVRRRGVHAGRPNRRQGEGDIGPRPKRKRIRGKTRLTGRAGGQMGGLGRDKGKNVPKEVHHEGMLDVISDENKGHRERLKVINKALKGKLTKSDRARLLEEKAGIKTSLAGNRVKAKELRTQGAEAAFEKSQGGNARIYNDYRTALAGSTAGLSDDIEAAQAEATYYKNREAFLAGRGDIAGAAEARAAFNSANQTVTQLQDQIAQAGLSYQASVAAGTKTLEDDKAAAIAARDYWAAKEQQALAAGDIVGAAEARQNFQAAADSIKDITDQIREAANRIKENSLSLRQQAAGFTGTLKDDLTVLNDSIAYWRDQLKQANLRGDTDAAFTAQTNINQFVDDANKLKDDMRRLPLERDVAFAALTEDVEDDTRAAIALRDYWKERLERAKREDDLAGQIEAAGQISTLNDQIKDAQENIAVQMVLLSEARRDLYKNFGSNFIPTMIQGASSYLASQQYPGTNQGTTVNLTVNGATLAQDPHTWSQNVAWELQAAV